MLNITAFILNVCSTFFKTYARENSVEIDDIKLKTVVGGSGEASSHSIVLTDLHIVGAIWDQEKKILVDLKGDDKTFNRLYFSFPVRIHLITIISCNEFWIYLLE